MLTFAADKRGFKLRHGINMPPTTCDRVNQLRRLGKSRKGETDREREKAAYPQLRTHLQVQRKQCKVPELVVPFAASCAFFSRSK